MFETHCEMNAAAEREGLWRGDRTSKMDRILKVYEGVALQAARIRAGQNPHVDVSEYECDAAVGLWKAAARFNPDDERGAAFSTFATTYIWGALLDRERESDHMPAKARAAEKRGDIDPLPVVFSVQGEASGEAALLAARSESDASCQARDELSAILSAADADAAEVLSEAMRRNFDLVALGEKWAGADWQYGVLVYRMARESVATSKPFICPPVPLPPPSPEMLARINRERTDTIRQHVRNGVQRSSTLCQLMQLTNAVIESLVGASGDMQVWQERKRSRRLVRWIGESSPQTARTTSKPSARKRSNPKRRVLAGC